MKLSNIFILHAIINFIAWNYFGILGIINTAIYFYIYDHSIHKKIFPFLLISYLYFFIFNITATFWLLYIKLFEGIIAITINSLFMTGIALLSYISNKTLQIPNYINIFFWVIFEVLHSQWALAWSWLTLGHVFGNQIYFVQWYSWTGVYSGSIWILLSGYFLNKAVNSYYKDKIVLIEYLIIQFTPIIISLILFHHNAPNITESKVKVAVYLPDKTINANTSNYKKTKIFYNNIKGIANIDYILTPESYYSDVRFKDIDTGIIAKYINLFIKKNKKITFLIGSNIIDGNNNRFNSVIVKNTHEILIKTKKKYVPFVEYTHPIFEKLYGKSYFNISSLDDTKLIIQKYGLYPVICYESLFSIYLTRISLKAKAFILLSSEKFLNNCKIAKKQYLNIVRLRAIETGKNILKCSDGGISCIINRKGVVVKEIIQNISIVELKETDQTTFYQTLLSYFN